MTGERTEPLKPARSLYEGQVFAGYVIEAELGRGGMGVVYRARQTSLDRLVALKVIERAAADDVVFQERFRREARTAASLEHPNIVPVYEAGEVDGRMFLAMRLIPGTDLADHLQRTGPMLPESALVVLEQTAAALEAAHAAGVLHRDVKPANVLVVGEAAAAYLTDFGVARRIHLEATLTGSGGVIGSAPYLAPEILRGEGATPASDVYSLGCTFFEMLTGRPPFPRADPVAVLSAHLMDEPPDLRDSMPALTGELAGVVRRSLEKQPARRFASTREFADAVKAALAGTPVPPVGGGTATGTELIGREQELAMLSTYLDPDGRVVTVTGAGGIGKTRLVSALVDRYAGRFGDGAAFVPLAALRDPDLLPAAIARELGAPEPGPGDSAAELSDVLAGRKQLVVLDNFEQLAPAGPWVAKLAAGAAGLKVVVTSRAPLGIAGERILELEPLSLPRQTEYRDGSSLTAESASALLFLARAHDVRPDLAVGAAEASSIAAICRRLDGIPLALELAAARTRHVSLPEIERRLDHSLALLSRGRTDMPARHQSLRATIEASHGLLEPQQQRLFGFLSVFAGGFDLDAAEAVYGDDGDGQVLDGLSALIDNSLLRLAPGARGRYSMLHVIREFAAEQAAQDPGFDRVRDAHLNHYLTLAEQMVPMWTAGTSGAELVEEITREHENFRAALDWAQLRRDGERLLRIAVALRMFWGNRGFRREGFRRVEAGLALAGDLDVRTRAQALNAAGGLRLGIPEQREKAKARLLEALALCESMDLPDVEFSAATYLTMLDEGDDGASAERWGIRALEVARRMGDDIRVGLSLTNLANIALERDDIDTAETYARQGLDALRESGEVVRLAVAHLNLAEALIVRGDSAEAAVHAGHGLRFARLVNDLEDTASALLVIAALAASASAAVEAVRLTGAVDKLQAECGTTFQPVEARIQRRLQEQLRNRLEDADFERASSEGRNGPLDDAVALAHELCARLAHHD